MVAHLFLGLFIILVGLCVTHLLAQYNIYYSDYYKEEEEDPFIDSEGNHIYYDRKYIRYQQQLKNKAAASQK